MPLHHYGFVVCVFYAVCLEVWFCRDKLVGMGLAKRVICNENL